MGFQKHKAGIIVAILCLIVLAAVAGFCLVSLGEQEAPEGTFVQWTKELPEVMA